MINASRAKTLSITPMIESIRPATAAPLKYAFFFAMPAIEKIVPRSPVRNGIPGNQHNTTVSIPIMSPATAIPLGRFAGAGSTAGAGAEGSGTGAPQLEQTVRLLGIYEPHLLQYMIVTCSYTVPSMGQAFLKISARKRKEIELLRSHMNKSVIFVPFAQHFILFDYAEFDLTESGCFCS